MAQGNRFNLALGSSLTRTFYGQPVTRRTEDAKDKRILIQNTLSAEDINKDENIDIGLIGDARLTLLALIDRVESSSLDDAKVRAKREEVQQEIANIKQGMAD